MASSLILNKSLQFIDQLIHTKWLYYGLESWPPYIRFYDHFTDYPLYHVAPVIICLSDFDIIFT
jgi:hypothetical protein